MYRPAFFICKKLINFARDSSVLVAAVACFAEHVCKGVESFCDKFVIFCQSISKEFEVVVNERIVGTYRDCHCISLQAYSGDFWFRFIVEIGEAVGLFKMAYGLGYEYA